MGPWFTGWLSDQLRPQYGDESLRWSLMICGLVNLWAAYHYYVAGKHLQADMAATARDETAPVTPLTGTVASPGTR
jgi:hypothetical protein